MTGIGGQGIQLAATVVARAALAEGREVQVFGSYGGMMRGGATESTLVVADGPLAAPPTVASAWSVMLMHHEYAEHARRCLAPGGIAFVNTSVVHGSSFDRSMHGAPIDGAPIDGAPIEEGHTVVDVAASDLAIEAGHVMAASMVMIGAFAAVTGLVRLSSLVAASAASLPAYRARHAALNERALQAGHSAVAEGTFPAWPDPPGPPEPARDRAAAS